MKKPLFIGLVINPQQDQLVFNDSSQVPARSSNWPPARRCSTTPSPEWHPPQKGILAVLANHGWSCVSVRVFEGILV